MCTACSFKTKDHYFGRNLDYEFAYAQTVTITPRNYPLAFRHKETIKKHYAIIGMAFVQEDYPLYYDATNEKGLSMAGLNFPYNADYKPMKEDKDNITPFEFIPWILGQCVSVEEARILLKSLNLLKENFSEQLPLSPLHWIIADDKESVVVESVKEGLKVYDNPVGILTNNPSFDYHLTNLNNYMHLSVKDPRNSFAKQLDLKPYSRGMGGMGLPGDLSSVSRFVKATFTKCNSVCDDNESSSISQFFHILGSVAQQKGCCKVEGGYEHTIYSSCCNTVKGIYYYTTYENSQITGVDMHKTDLESLKLTSYPLLDKQQIRMQN